jgi:hypothetical protein
MQRYIVFIVMGLLIMGCATPTPISPYETYKMQIKKKAEKNPRNYVEKAYAGVSVTLNDRGECEVVDVVKGSPADNADIRIGDIVLSIDGKKIRTRKQMFKLYDSKRPGEIMSAEIGRQGRVIKRDVLLDGLFRGHDIYVLNQELVKDIPLRMVIIVDEIDIQALHLNEKDMTNARKTYESLAYAELESIYVPFCSTQTNCSIIERHNMGAILQELKFQKSHLASDAMRVKIGQMSGATHVIMASFIALRKHENGFHYLGERKFVELKSGKILCSIVDQDEVLY